MTGHDDFREEIPALMFAKSTSVFQCEAGFLAFVQFCQTCRSIKVIAHGQIIQYLPLFVGSEYADGIVTYL